MGRTDPIRCPHVVLLNFFSTSPPQPPPVCPVHSVPFQKFSGHLLLSLPQSDVSGCSCVTLNVQGSPIPEMSKLNCIRIVLILSGAIPALVGRVPKKIHKATNTTSTHNRICEHAEDERPPCTVVRVLLVCTSGTTVALELRPATPPAIGERLRWFTVFAVLNAVDDATPPPFE